MGFVRNTHGCFEMISDWGMIGDGFVEREAMTLRLEQQAKRIHRKLRQDYALKTVLEQTQLQGFDLIEQQEEADGAIRVLVRRWVE
jgi:hypothetical protein